MSFYLATYEIDGTYRGLIPLENQLQVCTDSQKNTDFLKFGNFYENKCIYNLKRFISDLGDTLFYDMCKFLSVLVHSSDLRDGKYLRPVPVLNLNYRSNGLLVNVNKQTSENINDQYTRRFFVFDNLSGVSSSSNSTLPRVIRFAESIELT